MTLVHGGGITHLKKAADFAALYHVRTGCHGATDLSPVCMAAALHFGTAHSQLRHPGTHAAHGGDGRVFPHALFLRGRVSCIRATRPGLGVDLDEDLAAKYPYQRAYLPVNRKLDGTLTDW